MSKTIQKTAKFRSLLADMETYLPQAEAAFQKLAEDQAQGPKENDVAVADADGEVAELLPGGTKPGTETPPESNPFNNQGTVPSVDGAGTSPSEEEHQYHEQSPTAKVAAASQNFNKLAEMLLKTAGAKDDGTSPAPKPKKPTLGKPADCLIDKTKTAGQEQESELSPEEIADLTRKIAAARSDALVGRTLADMVLSGFADHAQKVAAAQVDADAIRTAVHKKVAAMRELNYTEGQIGDALEQMGRIDGHNLKLAEGGMPPEMAGGGGGGEVPPGAMGGEGAMMGAMEPGGAEGGMPPGAEGGGGMPGGQGGDLPPELQEIVQALTQMIQSGQVTPDEAIEAAQLIDQQLGISPGGGDGGGGGMPPGAGMPPGGGEGGPPQEGGEGGPPQESPEGGGEGGEGPPKEAPEGGGEKGDSEKEEKSESKDEKKKEARLYEIGVGIRHKVAEMRCQNLANHIFHGRMYPARKVAAMCAEGTEVNAAARWVYEEERRKIAGRDFGITDLPSPDRATLEDVFGLLDNLIANNSITEKYASAVLEDFTVDGDIAPIVGLFNMVQGVLHGTKLADGEGMAIPPVDPAQGGGEAPPPPPAAGGGAAPAPGDPPTGAEGGDVDPQQAVEQLIGALEQLVQAGIIDEPAAVNMLNQAGLGAPPAGGAPGAGPPAPTGAPPPAPEGGAAPPQAGAPM